MKVNTNIEGKQYASSFKFIRRNASDEGGDDDNGDGDDDDDEDGDDDDDACFIQHRIQLVYFGMLLHTFP